MACDILFLLLCIHLILPFFFFFIAVSFQFPPFRSLRLFNIFLLYSLSFFSLLLSVPPPFPRPLFPPVTLCYFPNEAEYNLHDGSFSTSCVRSCSFLSFILWFSYYYYFLHHPLPCNTSAFFRYLSS